MQLIKLLAARQTAQLPPMIHTICFFASCTQLSPQSIQDKKNESSLF